MALSSLTRQQVLPGVWFFFSLRTRKACPNTAVWARTDPLLYPLPNLDSGHSSPSFWVPSLCLRPTILSSLLVPRGFRGAPLYFPPSPPTPFPRTTVCVPISSLPTEEYSCGCPARPHPAGLPWPGLPDGINASRGPFRSPPPPHSIAMRVLVRSHPPFRAFCSGLQYVGDLRHGRHPRDQVTALANRGTLINSML